MTKEVPDRMEDWLRREWHSDTHDKKAAAHPNSRFCCPASQCPIIDPKWEDPAGVPIDAIIFGGRRADTVPLVYESRSWAHGTYLGKIFLCGALFLVVCFFAGGLCGGKTPPLKCCAFFFFF